MVKVRILSGKDTGRIVEQSRSAAESNVSMGLAEFVPVRELPPEPQEEEKEPPPYAVYHLGRGKWDVHDAEGKAVNEAPLSRVQAEEMADELNAKAQT